MSRRSLRHFMRGMWPVVEPTTPFVGGWHLDAVCDHLQAVRLGIKNEHAVGAIRRLIVNIPPRMTKSLTVSVGMPAWTWTDIPSFRSLHMSYAEDLSIRDSIKTRAVILSPWYQRNWGHVYKLSGDQNAKCLASGTQVLMASGDLLAIENVRPGDKVLSVSPTDECVVEDVVKHVWSNGSKPVRKITLSDGTIIRATHNHRFYGWDSWVYVDDMKVGDAVAVLKRIPDPLKHSDMTEDEAFLVALWLSEGSKHDSSYTVTTVDEKILQRLRGICAKHKWSVRPLGECSHVVKADSNSQTGYSPLQVLKRHLGSVQSPQHKRRSKLVRQHVDGIRVPASVFRASDAVVREFVGTYVACDGTILNGNNPGVYVTSVSSDLVYDFAMLLKRLGVKSNVSWSTGNKYTYRGEKRPCRDAWILSVKEREEVKKLSGVYFYGKTDRFSDLMRLCAINKKKDGGPHSSIPAEWDRGLARSFRKPSERRRWTSRARVEAFAKRIKDEHLTMKMAGDLDWRKIVGIEELPAEETWHMETAATHTFIAEGMYSHNTRFDNDKTGFRLATSVGGLATGEGGDGLFIDDPHNVKDTLASSGLALQEVADWFDFVVQTRLNNQKTGFIVVIMQRSHHKDLTGHILAKELGYTHLCYDDKTEVLSRSGWKLFKDLGSDDEVMAVSPDTLVGKWERPTSRVKYSYRGKMKIWKSDVLDLAVTPDHRMVYKDYNDWEINKRTKWRVAPASQLPRHFYVPQTVVWKGSSESPSFAGKMWDAGAFADFMGWYLAEGYASAKACSTRIVQSAKSPYVKDIDRALAAIPFSHRKFDRGSGMLEWVVYNKPLAVALAAFGKSRNKRIPEQIKNMTPRLLERFLLSFARGDGNFSKRNPLRITIYSSSKYLIDDLQECTVKIGWAASVNSCPYDTSRPFPNGYNKPSGTVWKLYIRASKSVSHDRKWYAKVGASNCFEENYDGEVFCVSVPSTALVVRRNGRVAVSGNCLPMEYEANHPHKWAADPRSIEGELLCPERLGAAELVGLKKSMGSYGSAGQLQQRPAPREGGLIKRSFFQVVGSAPAVVDRRLRWWDMAATKKIASNDPDWTAGARVSMTADGLAYVEHVVAEREGAAAVERVVKNTAKADGHDVDVWMEQEPGSSGKTVITSFSRKLSGLGGFKFRGERSGKAKETYVELLAAAMESGTVFWVRGPWLEGVIDEACAFPNGSHDDRIDAVAKAYCKLATRVRARTRVPGEAEVAQIVARLDDIHYRALETVKNSGGEATVDDFVDWHEPVGGQLWADLEGRGLVAADADGRAVVTPAGHDTLQAGPAGAEEISAQQQARQEIAEQEAILDAEETDWEALAEQRAREIYGDAVVNNWDEAAARGID